jgi:hypothetical protein
VPPWTKDGLRVAGSIFEAAAYHKNVKVVCRCGHHACYEAHCLWYLFERRLWDDAFWDVRRRFWCRPCRQRTGEKVRPRWVGASLEPITVELPWPSELEWKRAQRRVR